MSKRPNDPYKDHPLLGKRPTEKSYKKEYIDEVMTALREYYGLSKRDRDWLGKLGLLLALEFVPAMRPQKRGGRPREHSARDIMWAKVEFGRVCSETGLDNVEAGISKMAEDVEYWRDTVGLGETKKEIKEALRYILTDRIRQPNISREVEKEFLALWGAMKKTHLV